MSWSDPSPDAHHANNSNKPSPPIGLIKSLIYDPLCQFKSCRPLNEQRHLSGNAGVTQGSIRLRYIYNFLIVAGGFWHLNWKQRYCVPFVDKVLRKKIKGRPFNLIYSNFRLSD